MTARSFLLHRRKSTDYKVCYRDILDRIGNVYLPRSMAERLGDQITVQLAREKSQLQESGYVTAMYPYKETLKKVRFKENTWEPGALGVIYVSKETLQEMGLDKGEIAVRIMAGEEEEKEDEKLARGGAT
ncbi:MAG: hypothetical protein HPY89_05990 [Pelotomaculum sp.]|nr:hypothetical protein [Pelotomaculum sp.]